MTTIVGTQEYARIDSLLRSIGTLAKSEATDLLLGSVRDDLDRIRRYHENAQADADAGRQEASVLRSGLTPKRFACRTCSMPIEHEGICTSKCPGLRPRIIVVSADLVTLRRGDIITVRNGTAYLPDGRAVGTNGVSP